MNTHEPNVSSNVTQIKHSQTHIKYTMRTTSTEKLICARNTIVFRAQVKRTLMLNESQFVGKVLAEVITIINTFRPRQNGRHFPDDIFKWIFFNENVWMSIKISLKFVSQGPINNKPALVQIMAWRRPGDKP